MLAFFSTGLLGAFGLYRRERWGFIAFYTFFLVATFLGISIIPFLTRIVPFSPNAVLAVGNLLALGLVVMLHLGRRNRAAQTALG